VHNDFTENDYWILCSGTLLKLFENPREVQCWYLRVKINGSWEEKQSVACLFWRRSQCGRRHLAILKET